MIVRDRNNNQTTNMFASMVTPRVTLPTYRINKTSYVFVFYFFPTQTRTTEQQRALILLDCKNVDLINYFLVHFLSALLCPQSDIRKISQEK